MSPLGATEVDRLILESALHANVLALSSRCDSRCVFCSHKNNPPGIAVAHVGLRSMDDVRRTIAFLSPEHVITIGESATPIVEGEPLTHPDLPQIVELLRRAFPDTPVEITTNGRHLTAELIAAFEAAGGLSLSVSLNSASVRGRQILMGDSPEQSRRALEGVQMLGRSTLRFSGSLVAMPNLVGWDDLRATVRFLAENGAQAVRVIVPAWSDRADSSLFPDAATIFSEVRRFVAGMTVDAPCPVLLEPSCATDLTPVVSGVVSGSPAWRAGIRAGDVFVDINGKELFSRVDAWKSLSVQGPVQARVVRGGATREVSWFSDSEGASGVTMEYDFDPERAKKLGHLVAGGRGRSLLLASEFGSEVVGVVVEQLGLDDGAAEVFAVKNLTFGGTIRAAGLLTVDDYLAALDSWRRSRSTDVAQLIVPLESFDFLGLDLKRRHSSELARAAGVPVFLA